MQPALRRYLTYALLASYGVVGLLGQGLHSLSHDERHRHGLGAICGSHHGAEHADHGHHHARGHHGHHSAARCHHAHCETPLQVADGGRPSHAHECDICAFLLQLRSERPHAAAAIVWHDDVAAAPAAPQSSYFPVFDGPQSPRGPPLDLA